LLDPDDNDPVTFKKPHYFDYDGTPASRANGTSSPILYYPEGRTRSIPLSQFDKLAESLTYAEFEQRLKDIGH